MAQICSPSMSVSPSTNPSSPTNTSPANSSSINLSMNSSPNNLSSSISPVSTARTILEKLTLDKDGFAIPRLVRKRCHQEDDNPTEKRVQKLSPTASSKTRTLQKPKTNIIRMPKPQHPNINVSINITDLIKS